MPVDPALAKIIDEEQSYVEAVDRAAFRVLSRIRHSWSDTVDEEHSLWLPYSQALVAALERTNIQGRPGLKLSPIDLLPFAMNTVSIPAATVRTAVARILPNLEHRQLDSRVQAPTQYEFMKFLAYDWTNTFKPYLAEIWDCDDFAFYLAARCRQHGINSVGFVVDWSGGHSYNCVVFADGSAAVYEPQNDAVVQTGTGIFKAESGFVVL